MTFRLLLIWVSLGILIFILWDSCKRVDIAATKNDHLTAWKKAEVDSIQSNDSIRKIAKTNYDVIRQNFKNESKLAVRRSWLVLVLLMIHVYLLINWKANKGRLPYVPTKYD